MERLEKALQKAREQRADLAAQQALANAQPLVETPKAEEAPKPAERDNAGTQQTRRAPPPDGVLDDRRIVARQTRDAHADIFRMLRTKVLQQMNQAGARTMAVTSPRYGDGKTTVAVNLALSLAMDVNQTVLLVDLDLRDPTLHLCLGLEPEVGINDYLLHDTPIPSCMVQPGFERIVVLPASRMMDQSSEILATPKMAALAKELKSRYPDRIVIYDMPPLLMQDDVIAFLPHVEAVLLVVKEGTTQLEEVRKSLKLLDGKNFLGTVINYSTEINFNA